MIQSGISTLTLPVLATGHGRSWQSANPRPQRTEGRRYSPHEAPGFGISTHHAFTLRLDMLASSKQRVVDVVIRSPVYLNRGLDVMGTLRRLIDALAVYSDFLCTDG